jgi:cephalosporin hydroxylase
MFTDKVGKLINFFDVLRMKRHSRSMINLMSRQDYAHNLNWFGIQIFQTPTDLFLYQKLIFEARPKVIIETGVAKGGSLLFACQMLDMLHGKLGSEKWKIICAEINSLEKVRKLIDDFGYSGNVVFFQGDSVSAEFQNLIKQQLLEFREPRVLISLDSNHTEDHVFNELNSLSKFVSLDSFVIVWDSRIGDLSRLTHFLRPRAWSKKRHAGTGALLFMRSSRNSDYFEVCYEIESQFILAGTKNGILRRKQSGDSQVL